MYKRKRVYRKKKVYKRKPGGRRKYRAGRFKKNVYYYSRYTRLTNITVNGLTTTIDSLVFRLDDLPSLSDFVNLYDMFKIKAIKLRILPQMTENVSSGSINNPQASQKFYSAIDRNGGTPATIDEIREYGNCKSTSILRPHIRYIYKPQILDRGGTYTPGTPWLSLATGTDQVHYSLVYGVDPVFSTSTTTFVFSVEAKYYVAFKSVK